MGVATKEEFAVKSHASSVAVDETKSSLAAADKGTAKRDFNSSDEEVLRLMNPAVVAGKWQESLQQCAHDDIINIYVCQF